MASINPTKAWIWRTPPALSSPSPSPASEAAVLASSRMGPRIIPAPISFILGDGVSVFMG